MWFKLIIGILLLLVGLQVLVPFLGIISIADGGGGIIIGHFLPMLIVFALGAGVIALGAWLLGASGVRGAFLGPLVAGGLLALFGASRTVHSGYWLWKRPDIWSFWAGDTAFWLAYTAFGIFVLHRALFTIRPAGAS